MGKIKKIFLSEKFYFLTIFVAIVLLRCVLFGAGKSFWLDEAALAHNILQRSFLGLFSPLDFAQSAPYLFLVLTKILTLLFGKSEAVFRFLPFLASAFSIFAFYLLAKTVLKEKFLTLFSVFVFGLSYCMLYYSIEFKPYSFDVLFCILIFLLFFKHFNNLTLKKEFLFSFVFNIFPYFSFASIFPLAAISCLSLFKKKFIFPSITLLNIILQNFFIFQRTKTETGIYNYWQPFFINFNPLKVFTVFTEILKYFFYPSKFIFIFIILFITGLFYLFKKDKKVFYPFVLTILAGFSASFLNLYPLFNRAALFLYPIFLIIIFYPFCGVLSKKGKILTGLLIFSCAISSVFYPFWNIDIYKREEIKPLISKMMQEISKDDKVFVFKGSRQTFNFYKPEISNEIHICRLYENSFNTLENFCENSSCWIIYTSEFDGYKSLEELNKYVGEKNGKAILNSKGAILFKVPKHKA